MPKPKRVRIPEESFTRGPDSSNAVEGRNRSKNSSPKVAPTAGTKPNEVRPIRGRQKKRR